MEHRAGQILCASDLIFFSFPSFLVRPTDRPTDRARATPACVTLARRELVPYPCCCGCSCSTYNRRPRHFINLGDPPVTHLLCNRHMLPRHPYCIPPSSLHSLHSRNGKERFAVLRTTHIIPPFLSLPCGHLSMARVSMFLSPMCLFTLQIFLRPLSPSSVFLPVFACLIIPPHYPPRNFAFSMPLTLHTAPLVIRPRRSGRVAGPGAAQKRGRLPCQICGQYGTGITFSRA